MRAKDVLWQKKSLYRLLFIVLGLLVFAGCGTGSDGIGTGSAPPTSSTAGTGQATHATAASPTARADQKHTAQSPVSTSQPVQGYGSVNGCPSDVVVNSAPAAADVTIRPGDARSAIVVHKGAVIEVQMPFGIAWKGPFMDHALLQLQSPAGYAWKPGNACIWRFVARDAGTVVMSFSGLAPCKQHILCTPAEMDTEFTINVE